MLAGETMLNGKEACRPTPNHQMFKSGEVVDGDGQPQILAACYRQNLERLWCMHQPGRDFSFGQSCMDTDSREGKESAIANILVATSWDIQVLFFYVFP